MLFSFAALINASMVAKMCALFSSSGPCTSFRRFSISLSICSSGNILNVITKNVPTAINGTKFTGHALDQMQARGVLSPNAVLDVVKNPTSILEGNTPGTTVFIRDNLKIVTNTAREIVTVILQ